MKQWLRFCRVVLASMLAVVAVSTTLHAAPAAQSGEGSVEQAIRQNLEQSLPELSVASVEASEVPGLYAVKFEKGPTVYATADARHFVLGDLFRIESTGLVNLAEQQRNQMRAELINRVPRDEVIVFSPKGKPRAVVNVFTDVECPGCRRPHEEVPALNAMGVEVRYLAYPRAGAGSPAYRKMVSAWCAKDPQKAMERLKKQQSITENLCKDNPVTAQFELGNRLGVNGTPALITQDGRLLPGYLPADKLAAELGLISTD